MGQIDPKNMEKIAVCMADVRQNKVCGSQYLAMDFKSGVCGIDISSRLISGFQSSDGYVQLNLVA
jgi:hypothetical protein